MKTTTVNIAFPQGLLSRIDEMAEEESRSRSELLREAVRRYLERAAQWERIFAFGRKHSKRLGLKLRDVEGAIRSYRRRAHR